jgi:hypothetical protein
MTMVTARYVETAADSKVVRVNSDTGWRLIGRGLGVVAFGYASLLVGGVFGALLLYEAASGRSVLGQFAMDAEGLDDLRLLGVVVLGAGAVPRVGAVLLGQWLCLMYAPQGGGAKEWIYVCFTCVVMSLGLTVAGICLDGRRVYAALGDGLGGWRQFDWGDAGVLLLAAGIALGLVGVLVFTQFLRSLAAGFRDRARVLWVDLNLWAVGVLLGGSAGATGVAYRLAPEVNLTLWLAGGWLACFAWHVGVILSVRRCVRDNLRRHDLARASRARIPALGRGDSHSLSGMHRLARRAAESPEDRGSPPPNNQSPDKPDTAPKAAPNKAPRAVVIIAPRPKEK